ncbi:MAG: aminopeptidase [Pseudohongiellaceae bacterium]
MATVTTTVIRRALIIMAVSVLLSSCETINYYGQAAQGQLNILFSGRDITRLLADEDLDSQLRQQLELVLEIREFAADELALPVADNYSTYVDLKRDYAVWNVFAADEFSTEPRDWCFPVAGCVIYRGYFSEAGANRYGQQLVEDGLDVYIGGVAAYSTLGWFSDSLPSSVIERSPSRLAALIFHELAHQVVYVRSDTIFNESFATTVEREGLRRWLKARGTQTAQAGQGAQQAEEEGEAPTLAEQEKYQIDFVALVNKYRKRLDAVYATELEPDAMRAEKARVQEELRAAYAELKITWSSNGGDSYDGYDAWFAGPLNNAQLATVAYYNDLVPAFTQLLAGVNGDLPSFYALVRKEGRRDAGEQLLGR